MRGHFVSAWWVIVRLSWRPRGVEKRRLVVKVVAAVAAPVPVALEDGVA